MSTEGRIVGNEGKRNGAGPSVPGEEVKATQSQKKERRNELIWSRRLWKLGLLGETIP